MTRLWSNTNRNKICANSPLLLNLVRGIFIYYFIITLIVTNQIRSKFLILYKYVFPSNQPFVPIFENPVNFLSSSDAQFTDMWNSYSPHLHLWYYIYLKLDILSILITNVVNKIEIINYNIQITNLIDEKVWIFHYVRYIHFWIMTTWNTYPPSIEIDSIFL